MCANISKQQLDTQYVKHVSKQWNVIQYVKMIMRALTTNIWKLFWMLTFNRQKQFESTFDIQHAKTFRKTNVDIQYVKSNSKSLTINMWTVLQTCLKHFRTRLKQVSNTSRTRFKIFNDVSSSFETFQNVWKPLQKRFNNSFKLSSVRALR